MCWLKWESIDWDNRIINIQRTTCDETSRVWLPKDHETRRLDVKEGCIDFLADEHRRQEAEGILGPFVLPGGDKRRKAYRNRPLSAGVPQKAFSEMIGQEDMDPRITV